MSKYTELYKSASVKDDDGKLLVLLDDAMIRLEHENSSLYKHIVNEMEEIAYSITRSESENIVHNMRPRGQQWSYQRVDEICKSKGIEGKTTDFYLCMNMAYNDYYDTAALYGLQKDEEFYFSVAKDFIYDADAKPHKVARYFI